ncbi:MAG: DMT family protein [Candidatus Kapabacteria bacterium]|nr:DMT family protein [Candidatus Kapabacteria bacterium]
MKTIVLLLLSNLFMTFAWYGHLKFRDTSLWKVILISWFIALPEYILQVPANRIGYGTFSAFELKTIQEVITLTVFIAFSAVYLREAVRWNHIVGFLLIVAAVVVIFRKW